jgi:hypothetical protein
MIAIERIMPYLSRQHQLSVLSYKLRCGRGHISGCNIVWKKTGIFVIIWTMFPQICCPSVVDDMLGVSGSVGTLV